MGRKTFESFPKLCPMNPITYQTRDKDINVNHTHCIVVQFIKALKLGKEATSLSIIEEAKSTGLGLEHAKQI